MLLQEIGDLTVVVFAQSEGVLLRACVASVMRAVAQARGKGWSIELVLVLHNPTARTEDWVERFIDPGWRIIRCPDSRLSVARNEGCRAANGRYVTFVDGPDLWSENWISAALAAAEETSYSAVWHPEATIRFGTEYFSDWGYGISFHPDAVLFEYDYAELLSSNPYSSSWMAPRSILHAVPFPCEDPATGWDCVDWWWNCNVVGAGYHHRVVLNTLHYQRIGTDGIPVAAKPKSANSRIGPTPLARGPLPALPPSRGRADIDRLALFRAE
jgi:glycosyltransferase involved in cell wall biosynthesis